MRGWPRIGDGWGLGGYSLTESAAQAWVSSALFAFWLPGFVTALSDRFRSGGRFPAQQLYCFNPARPSTARLADEMPPLREGDRYFWGCAYRAAIALCLLPRARNMCLA